ncbi:MAG: lipoic acid synthetase [Puniceicoccaceae bacterium 5H]|nr:MAG: lipoic acid synthetase [Puniceicoccaceae bacterium 5H]
MSERKPSWLRAKLPTSPSYKSVRGIVEEHELHTVCQSARCPNMGECWSRRTATLMILGNTCTRACTFCAIQTGRPTELDLGEPARVAMAVKRMGLKHAVITSVSRDDLKDGGAGVWAATIRAIRYKNPETAIEVLIPDFRGNLDQLDIVLDAEPDILNHNFETVPRLQRPVRKTANWEITSKVLEHAKSRGFTTKTGIMLGIGEEQDEIEETMRHFADIKIDIVTIGQYLQPTKEHRKMTRWVQPEEFEHWKQFGLDLGIGVVESGALVRSSYHADEQSDRFVRKGEPKTEDAAVATATA